MKADFYTTSEAAEIGGVSDQLICSWCDAYQTESGNWRIPQKYLR